MGVRELNVRKIMKQHHSFIGGRKKRTKRWNQLGSQKKLETGITVHYFRDPEDKYYFHKMKGCEVALEFVSKKFQLPSNMFVYFTTDFDSAGYVSTVRVGKSKVRDFRLKEGGYVFLGNTSIGYNPMKEGTAKLYRGGEIDDNKITKFSPPKRLVADQVYDKFKAQEPKVAKRAKVMAACVHELGHILHQMDWESAYYDCMELEEKVVDREVFEKASKYVSEYAASDHGKVHEFVAETFCGLVCELEYEQHVIDLYNILDGPGKSFSVDMWDMITLK
jgi:hypothetical protein